MAVVRNGDYWVYEWKIGGKTVRRSSGFKIDTPREHVRESEELARRKALAELGLSSLPSSAPLTLSRAIERFYNEKWKRDRSGEKQYRNAMVAAKIIGLNRPLEEITSKDLAHLKASLLEQGKAGSTVNRHLSAIMVVLNHAARYWEVLDRVPAVKREDESDNARIRVVTWEEEKRILKACEELGDRDFADLYIVLVDTGLRRNEALTLTYSRNIDFASGVVTVFAHQHKNKRSKSVPMTKRAQEVLIRRRTLGDKPFGTFTPDSPLKRFQKVLKVAGLASEDIVIHSLRHTFAARLANAGVPIYEVSKLLGHSSVKTTEKYYAHLFMDTLRSSIGVLDAQLKRL